MCSRMALLPEVGDSGHSFLVLPCPTGMGHSPSATSRNPSQPPSGPGLLPRCARSLSGEQPRWDCAAGDGWAAAAVAWGGRRGQVWRGHLAHRSSALHGGVWGALAPWALCSCHLSDLLSPQPWGCPAPSHPSPIPSLPSSISAMGPALLPAPTTPLCPSRSSTTTRATTACPPTSTLSTTPSCEPTCPRAKATLLPTVRTWRRSRAEAPQEQI